MNIPSIDRFAGTEAPAGAGNRSYALRGGRLTPAKKRILLKGNHSDYLLNVQNVQYYFDKAINWEETFNDTICEDHRSVEIGFGDGAALIQAALERPNGRFIGIETYLPGIASLLLSIQRLSVGNVRLLRADAATLFPDLWGENTLDEIRLFFPDPWPKKRHHKRRLLKKHFLETLILCLRPGGKLHILTDWSDYAEQISRAFGGAETSTDTQLRSKILDRQQLPQSKYGRKACAEGRDIVELCFIKAKS